MNAQEELLKHIKDREVLYVFIEGPYDKRPYNQIQGTLDQVLPLLDFHYDKNLTDIDGYIWYKDGSWSARHWGCWEHIKCPELPKNSNIK